MQDIDLTILHDDLDNISFDNVNEKPKTKIKVYKSVRNTKDEKKIIDSYSHEYIKSLKDQYVAEKSLFDNLEELIEESEDQELLLKVLDSL